MQYPAIIDGKDFWLLDSLAYAVKDADGGRIITVSWHTDSGIDRESLEQNIPMEIIFYDHDMKDIQLHLRREFMRTMKLMDKRYRGQQIPAEDTHTIE
jgi:hypothetical protein